MLLLADKPTIPLSAGTHLGLLPVVASREDGLAADSLAGACTTDADRDGDMDTIKYIKTRRLAARVVHRPHIRRCAYRP